MVRNIMGCLLAVGSGRRPADWLAEVLAARDRDAAAPTFAADGLYFVGPYYDAHLAAARSRTRDRLAAVKVTVVRSCSSAPASRSAA